MGYKMWTMCARSRNWVRSNWKQFGVVPVYGAHIVPLLLTLFVVLCGSFNLHAVTEAHRSDDIWPWGGGWPRDYTKNNLIFLERNQVDPIHYKGTTCRNEDPPFLKMRNIEAACSRWDGNREMLPWCVRLLAVSHCISVGGGIEKKIHKKGLTELMDKADEEDVGLMEWWLMVGKGPEQMYGGTRQITDHEPFFQQFVDYRSPPGGRGIGTDVTFTARDMDLALIRKIGCEMRKRGEYFDLLQELKCKK